MPLRQLLYCSTHVLVKRAHDGQEVAVVELGCAKWACPECSEKLKARIRHRVQAGKPTRFLTLTVNPNVGTGPLDRRELLADAWKRLLARWRRRHPGETIEHFVIVEETARGEPHFHIALRSPYIDQKWISNQMSDMIGAPIVDIRKIKTQRGVARYLSKYLAKQPAEWKFKRRAWASRGWPPQPQRPRSFLDAIPGGWERVKSKFTDWSDVLLPPSLPIWISTDGLLYAATAPGRQRRDTDIRTWLDHSAAQQQQQPPP